MWAASPALSKVTPLALSRGTASVQSLFSSASSLGASVRRAGVKPVLSLPGPQDDNDSVYLTGLQRA